MINGPATEKRPMIGINIAREVYNEAIVNFIILMGRKYSLAAAMTKLNVWHIFADAIRAGKIQYEVEQLIISTKVTSNKKRLLLT